jgi:hypothetical protein
MELLSKINNLFRPTRLSRRRMVFALFVAVVADGLQIPLQIPPLPEIIDVIAMMLTSAAIGFHVLLLPTFAIEFVPGAAMLPTWTGCVIAVLVLRRREEKNQPPTLEVKPPVFPPPQPPERKE